MLKYYLKYISGNKFGYVGAMNENEHKTALVIEDKSHATTFYGEGGIQLIAELLENDKTNPVIKDIYQEYEIVEEDATPLHHFELVDALQDEFGISMRKDVDKDFPLIVNGTYARNEATGLPIVNELCYTELLRYYEWLKQNKKRLKVSEGRQTANSYNLSMNIVTKINK